jgi:hypothetical protein
MIVFQASYSCDNVGQYNIIVIAQMNLIEYIIISDNI